ncbi:histidine kinase [Austwickia sp. TVS 96-490-7B]|uniref:histidine kinase n=1 Tax=Austwickia sp. TVS 96-490-7B TaxID=2830843 RepID=UPI001C567E49|nr:histidine kinase [Austwickia sp. TVS 96-490-7B]
MALVANTQPLKWVIALAVASVAWGTVASAYGVFRLDGGIAALLPILAGVVLQGAVLRSSLLPRRLERNELAAAVTRAETARAAERRRLAGELHDIVAHDLTILTMLSATGQNLDDSGRYKPRSPAWYRHPGRPSPNSASSSTCSNERRHLRSV